MTIRIISCFIPIFTLASYASTRLPATIHFRDGDSLKTEITDIGPTGDLRIAFKNLLLIRPALSLLSFDHEPVPFTEEPLVIAARTDVAITDTGPLYGFYGEVSDGRIGFLGIEWKESAQNPGTHEAIRSWLVPGSTLKRIYVAGGAYYEMFSRVPVPLREGLSLDRVRNIFHSRPALLAYLYVYEGRELPYRNLMAFFLAGRHYSQADAVLQEWLSVLSPIKGLDPTGVAGEEFRSLSRIRGLAAPELAVLCDRYFAAVNTEDWETASEARQLMASRQGKLAETVRLQPSLNNELEKAISLRSTLWNMVLTATPDVKAGKTSSPVAETGTLRSPGSGSGIDDLSQFHDALILLNSRATLVDSRYLDLINRAPRGQYGKLASALIFLQEADRQFLERGVTAGPTDTTVPAEEPDSVHVGSTPSYGFADFGSVVSFAEEQPPSGHVRDGLRLLDLLLR